jgi:hypothetical protein
MFYFDDIFVKLLFVCIFLLVYREGVGIFSFKLKKHVFVSQGFIWNKLRTHCKKNFGFSEKSRILGCGFSQERHLSPAAISGLKGAGASSQR